MNADVWQFDPWNVAAFVLMAVYGATFGVEIAVDNVLSKFFQARWSGGRRGETGKGLGRGGDHW